LGIPVGTNGRQYCFTAQWHRADKHSVSSLFESGDRNLSLHQFNDPEPAIRLPSDIEAGAGTEKVLACQTALCVGNQSHAGRFPPESAAVKPPTIVAQVSAPAGWGGVSPPLLSHSRISFISRFKIPTFFSAFWRLFATNSLFPKSVFIRAIRGSPFFAFLAIS
jgi:hypothetical protein